MCEVNEGTCGSAGFVAIPQAFSLLSYVDASDPWQARIFEASTHCSGESLNGDVNSQ